MSLCAALVFLSFQIAWRIEPYGRFRPAVVGVPELHRADQPEQVIPVIGDQLGLDGLGKQCSDVRVSGSTG
jgi:hypothetical protein